MTKIPAAQGGTLSAGEQFEFTNTGTTDVQLSGLTPPCVEPDCHVAANGTALAQIQAHVAPGDYPYTCNPGIAATNPKLHIST